MDILKTQTFDFSHCSVDEKITAWVEAVARIPLKRIKCQTFPETIAFIASKLGLEKHFNTQPKNERLFRIVVSENLEIDWDIYADMPEGWYGDGKDLFTICYDFVGHDEWMSEMRVFFLNDGTADITFDTDSCLMQREKELKEKYQILSGYISWQQAYDILCAIARASHDSVPKPPTV